MFMGGGRFLAMIFKHDSEVCFWRSLVTYASDGSFARNVGFSCSVLDADIGTVRPLGAAFASSEEMKLPCPVWYILLFDALGWLFLSYEDPVIV